MNVEVFRLALIIALLIQLIVSETSIEPVRDVNANGVPADIDINAIIRQAVQNELSKHGVIGLVNSESVNDRRVTHEVAGNSKVDLNRSTRNDCPGPSVLAKHNKIGAETDNCHMATEMGLPQAGNSNRENTTSGNRFTQSNRVPEFLTGNLIYNITNDVMNSTMIEHTHPSERCRRITRNNPTNANGSDQPSTSREQPKNSNTNANPLNNPLHLN